MTSLDAPVTGDPVTGVPLPCSLIVTFLWCLWLCWCRPTKKPLGPVGRRGATRSARDRFGDLSSTTASGAYKNRGTHGVTVSGAVCLVKRV